MATPQSGVAIREPIGSNKKVSGDNMTVKMTVEQQLEALRAGKMPVAVLSWIERRVEKHREKFLDDALEVSGQIARADSPDKLNLAQVRAIELMDQVNSIDVNSMLAEAFSSMMSAGVKTLAEASKEVKAN